MKTNSSKIIQWNWFFSVYIFTLQLLQGIFYSHWFTISTLELLWLPSVCLFIYFTVSVSGIAMWFSLLKRKSIICLGLNFPRGQPYVVFATWVSFASVVLFAFKACFKLEMLFKYLYKSDSAQLRFYIYKPLVLSLISLNLVFGTELVILAALSLLVPLCSSY